MVRSIVNTFSNCFKIPELKSRILFTIVVLAICRLEAYIRIPGLDSTALADFFEKSQSNGNSLLGLYGMFSGAAWQNCAIGGLGIMPYISATIIIQLLQAVYPPLSKMAREENGRTRLIKYGRYLTVVICLAYGFGTAFSWEHPDKIFNTHFDHPLILQFYYHNAFMLWWYRLQTALLLTTGTVLLMWLGEQITDRGIGNGVSLIITVNILSRLPDAVQGIADMFIAHGSNEAQFNKATSLVLVALLAVVIGGVIAITQAERKIPVQYAQRAVGRKMYAGGTSFLPLRLNYVGVMPIIFAQAILVFPQKICQFVGSGLTGNPNAGLKFLSDICLKLAALLQERSIFYLAVYSLMILFFSYFWVATQFNELQMADDLKKNNGYIPGVRPGQATASYLHNAMSRITLAGALFLLVIAVIPTIMYYNMGIPYPVAQFFGGTSILIVVGVLLDTMRQMESHLLMRHYDGFLKKGKVKGRF
jgi:preprotein translocase subunit SecY